MDPGRQKTYGEQRVVDFAQTGEVIDLRDLPDEHRILSPQLIIQLCTGPDATRGHPLGLRIQGARFVDALDLAYRELPHPLGFATTTFDVGPRFGRCKTPVLELIN